MTASKRNYLIYGDGSCLGNPGPGGWGVVVRDPDGAVREYNGSEAPTTNNRMELTAAIKGLRATEPGSNVVLRSDSQYVVNTMNLGWKRKANQDLWQQLDAESQIRDVEFEWVRGHDVDSINHRADELAVMGAKRRLIADQPRAQPLPRGQSAWDQIVENNVERLKPLLKPGERIIECSGCGEFFVSQGDDEGFCPHVRCQRKVRRP